MFVNENEVNRNLAETPLIAFLQTNPYVRVFTTDTLFGNGNTVADIATK